MARVVDKIVVEVELSAQDRRRIDRITKAVEALVKHKSATWTNSRVPSQAIHNHDPESARTAELTQETERALREFHRSAETGQFVTEEEARENPSTTVRET